jgi:integrin alpha FG-GAP repeat containing protein 1
MVNTASHPFISLYQHTLTDQIVDETWEVYASTDAQGTIFDDGGSLRPSLLAFEPQETGTGLLRSWHNNGTGLAM